jgi:hypothetical protein
MVHARTHDPVMTVVDHTAPYSNRYATIRRNRMKTAFTDGKRKYLSRTAPPRTKKRYTAAVIFRTRCLFLFTRSAATPSISPFREQRTRGISFRPRYGDPIPPLKLNT